MAIQTLDGAGCIRIGHFNKAETTGLSGVTIGDQADGLNGAVLREQFAYCCFIGRERQIANINFTHRLMTPYREINGRSRTLAPSATAYNRPPGSKKL